MSRRAHSQPSAEQPVAGSEVLTPFGKGTVREVRNNGRLLVELRGRLVEVRDREVALVPSHRTSNLKQAPPQRRGTGRVSTGQSGRPPREVDLHGLTVEEAISRAVDVLNEAMLADALEVRFIHGRSGGRIRAALHHRLRTLPGVRNFVLDSRNEGVTIVTL